MPSTSRSEERFESSAEINQEKACSQNRQAVQDAIPQEVQVERELEPREPTKMAIPLKIRAVDIVRVHTILALLAFISALVLGCTLHFKRIVKNGVAGYPQEWFPSVSATIGDWYPERSLFHILIALNSGPRFSVVFLQYFNSRASHPSLSSVVLVAGIIRTLSCGGWVYITSEDDHDAHDILMITYIICNIPWMLGGIACTPNDPECTAQRRKRIIYASIFFGLIVPMVYFFIQHKVYRIPGAYTRYAFFEWGLIFTDIMYDSLSGHDFSYAGIEIDISTSSRSPIKSPPNNVTMGGAEEKNTLSTRSNEIHHETTLQPKGISKLLYPVSARYRELISTVSDIYLSFIFWTLYTCLIPSLFYFSVWQLGIAGTELALLALLSPCALGISVIRNSVSTRYGRATLHFLSIFGLAAYKLPKPGHRLFFVFFANIFACMGVAIDLAGLSSISPEKHSINLGLGLVLSSLLKHANHANNPIWPMLDERSGGFNKTGIVLALLATAEFATRRTNDKNGKIVVRAFDKPTVGYIPSWFKSSMALGSLIFSLHCFLTDSSTIISWTWVGYPIRGPVPHVHGAYTLLTQCFGIGISLICPPFVMSSPSWFAFGVVSSYVLYSYKNWFGYFGGLGLVVFLMSIIPQVILDASLYPQKGRVYFTAFLVTILLHLASVWTVAYAFVPAGWLLRERTDLVLFVQIALLSSAFTWSRNKNIRTFSSNIELSTQFRTVAFGIIAIISILSGAVMVLKSPSTAPQPFRPGPRIFCAGIWTVHFGMDNEGRDSQRKMRDLIRDMELDVVGLLETDLHRPVYGNRDLTRVMVEELGYYVDLGPGPNQHTWGAVLLSKFPIINSTHHLLPSPHGELAPAISGYLNIYGTEVMVVIAHNGQEEDPLDRELQSRELARIMASSYPTPTIFLGYVVTKPHAPRPAPYKILVEDGKMYDIDEDDQDRWCEYILYRGLYRTSYLRMSRGTVTDTELQAGQFVVPRFGHRVTDESKEARYLRIYKETLDEQHWFPMEYYGDEKSGGKNGHFYHVFGTPLYYNIPEGAIL